MSLPETVRLQATEEWSSPARAPTTRKTCYIMSVQGTIRVRLKPTADQRVALLETMRLSTLCFNTVAAYGWQHGQRNGVELHKATYYQLRAEHPTLPSQLVVAA